MRRLLRTFAIGLACAVLAAAPAADLRAQTASASMPSLESALADASAKEAAVRKALGAPTPSRTVLKAVRTVVSDYEALLRLYPSSARADDMLWRAARLSAEAFASFGDPREQVAAVRLLDALTVAYPSSALVKNVPAQKAALAATPAKASIAFEPAAKTPTAPSRVATIKDVRRMVLGDVIRVVIELDMEVSFHDERIENPARVFVDLPSTRTAPDLKDQTLRFDGDTDPVRQVRLGRHPNQTTRIVLEAADVSSYSVYPLYSPYRLVIDCLRSTPELGAAPAPPAADRGSVNRPATADIPVRRLDASTDRLPVSRPAASAAIAEALAEPTAPAPVATNAPAALPSPPIGPPSRNMAGGFSIARQLGLSVSRIVIDPGHGGHDPGAKGGGTTEADLVLDVSLRLEKLLQKIPGIEVVLTRRDDEFVPLQERTALANREGADLFLSIHANANSSPQAHGVETYFLNFATNLSAAAVAARENAASGQAMGALPDVVKTIALNNKIDESRDFATFVQREMVNKLQPANKTLRNLGVKQAPFVVLIGAAMPSVLAEVSFLTNPQDARLLKSAPYRQKIAEALFDGVRRYQSSLKASSAVAQQSQQ